MNIELSYQMIKMLQSLYAIVVIYIIALIVTRSINKRVHDLKRRYDMRKRSFYVAGLLMIGIVGIIWIKDLRGLTVVLSVIGAGLVVSLAEVFLCIAGWFLIITRRPFDTGDRIEFGGVKGDVIDIRLFQTSLLEIGNWVVADQSTGRIVHIPNSMIFKSPSFNYTRGFEFIWNEVKIVVTFESDWKKAKAIMVKQAQKEGNRIKEEVDKRIRHMSKHYLIYYEKLTPIVYTNIIENGVELSLRYLTQAKERRHTQDELCQKILDEFENEKGINFAYPTYRIIKN
ncbi:MAG: mechanosensitive ion channel family protein [Candidatus Omnitrophica bacterium]|nr:mechanosensitive ion channel family protein [Candidatus Omnitrophota bacterium]